MGESTFHFVAVVVTGLLTGCNPPVETARVAVQQDDVPQKLALSEKRPNQANFVADECAPSLSGQVLDERGDPIAGAEVRIGHYATNNVAAITDEKGRFSIDDGAPPADVALVSAPGKAIELVKLSELRNAGKVSVTLMPGHVLTLRVVDEQGNPLQGVQVSGDEWRGTALLLHFTTNQDGIIEWKEAPTDAIEFFISKPGYCKLMNLKLVASDAIQDVVLTRVLQIAGQVRDAATGDPIEHFELSPVLQFESGATVTNRGRAWECLDGQFTLEFDRVDASHAVRIEAEGYRTQMTQMFRVSEPVGEINVELHAAAPLTGVVVSPEGTPVPGADVYLATPSMPVELMGGVARGSNNLGTTTDADGRNHFPAQFEQFTIVVIADQGFAVVPFQPDEPPGEIRLQAWSRVSGVLTQSGQPAPNQVVELKSIRLDDRHEPKVHNLLRTTTGDDVGYSFARVPPGKYSLQADVSIWKPSDLTCSEAVPLELLPGEARAVQLGGNGSDIVGRVEAVGAAGIDLRLNYSLNYLLRKSAGIVPPDPVAAKGFDWKTGWHDTWDRTSEGVAYHRCLHHWLVKLAPDGSFRICGVPPGEYELFLQLYEPPNEGCLVAPLGTRRISFDLAEENLRQTLDLGQIEVAVSTGLKVGDVVPDFSFETTDGSMQRLADYRGKWVLIDMWATWCGSCIEAIPDLARLHETLSHRRDLVMLGLCFDRDIAVAKQFTVSREVRWFQGFLGDWSATNVPRQLGVTTLPTYLLIDPQGRLRARAVNVGSIRASLDQVLGEPP